MHFSVTQQDDFHELNEEFGEWVFEQIDDQIMETAGADTAPVGFDLEELYEQLKVLIRRELPHMVGKVTTLYKPYEVDEPDTCLLCGQQRVKEEEFCVKHLRWTATKKYQALKVVMARDKADYHAYIDSNRALTSRQREHMLLGEFSTLDPAHGELSRKYGAKSEHRRRWIRSQDTTEDEVGID